MTEQEFDRMLRAALLEANRADYAAALEEDWPTPLWSRGYLRRRRALLADPAGYARRAARPAWKKALRTAAAILLAVSISLGAVVATVPQARAWVEKMLIQIFEQYDIIHILPGDEEPVEDSGYWLPQWLPEGFELAEEYDLGDGWRLIFTGETDAYITLTIYPVQEGAGFNIDNEHSTPEDITINGRSAYLRRSNTPDDFSYVIWTNSVDTVAFRLSGAWDVDELIRMAESVTRVSD